MDTIDSVFIDLEGQIKHLSGSAIAGQVISVLFLFFVFLGGVWWQWLCFFLSLCRRASGQSAARSGSKWISVGDYCYCHLSVAFEYVLCDVTQECTVQSVCVVEKVSALSLPC